MQRLSTGLLAFTRGARTRTDSVVVSALRDGTGWFGAIRALRIDPGTGHLLTLDQHIGRVAEFTPTGRLIRRYGGPSGQGPQEVRRAMSFAFSDSLLFLLDRGNRKIFVYDCDTRNRYSEEGEILR